MKSKEIGICFFIFFSSCSILLNGQEISLQESLLSSIEEQLLPQEMEKFINADINTSFKEDELESNTAFKKKREKKNKPRYQKTEGIFVNVKAWGNPLALQMGKRVTSKLNIGGQIGVVIGEDLYLNLALCSRYYFTDNESSGKPYMEGNLGLAFETANKEGTNQIKPYGAFSLGYQMASRKNLRFFFSVGVQSIFLRKQTIINNPTVTVIDDKYWSIFPQITLLGLEF